MVEQNNDSSKDSGASDLSYIYALSGVLFALSASYKK